MDIKSSKKFLNNSPSKQLLHMTSELIEIWVAWIIYKIKPNPGTKFNVSAETTDLQVSCQTFLEGPMGESESQINNIRKYVTVKNNEQGYYEVDK